MSSSEGRVAFVHGARLRLRAVEPAAVGGAVTTALCGSWGHVGPCRWPHHNDIRATDGTAELRTVFVAPAGEEAEVRGLVDAALIGDRRWSVLGSGAGTLSADEQALAGRLATTPQP